MKKVVSLILVCAFMLLNCASIFKGNSSKLDLSSDPDGATVYVNGNPMGKTPIKLKLESKKTYFLEFKKEGYETRTFNITNNVGAGWIVLDIILGLVPVIVDAATGAWYGLDQDHVNAILEKEQKTADGDTAGQALLAVYHAGDAEDEAGYSAAHAGEATDKAGLAVNEAGLEATEAGEEANEASLEAYEAGETED